MIFEKAIPKHFEKTCPSASSSTTNLVCTDMRSNPDLRGERPATKLLSDYLDCYPGIYRNYYKTMNILDSVSMA